jgi:hypothetical protein
MGIAFGESATPVGSANPPVQALATPSNATDTYYILGFALAESMAPSTSAGSYQVTETGSAGGDTYYVVGFVMSEH